MNAKHFLLMLALALALVSCGLKRNLTLPKDAPVPNSSGSSGAPVISPNPAAN